jgi:uncharacterized protein (DUF2141 family)
MKTILLSAALSLTALCTYAQNLEIVFKDIKTTKGNIPLAVFTSDENFKANKALKLVRYPKKQIVNGSMTVYLELAPGTYGLSVMDDENADGKFDKNIFGIPREGFGFSNYYHNKMSHPHFENFKIKVTGQKQKVEIRMRYL